MLNERLKVALVTPSYAPRVGGVEVHVERLAYELVVKGNAVEIFTQIGPFERRSAGEQAKGNGASSPIVHEFRDSTGSKRFRMAPGLPLSLRRSAHTFDIVHAHGFHAWPALASTFGIDRPFVFTPHYHGYGHTPMARVLHVPYDRIARRIFRQATKVICVSQAEANQLAEDYPGVSEKIRVIRNGVDIESFSAVGGHVAHRPVVASIGRLERYKQVDRLLSAFSLVKSQAELVVVGDGPLRENLESQAKSMDRVRFLGRVGNSDLRKLQRMASVTVSLSLHEAYGLIVAEAVVGGGRAIVSNIPAHAEIAREFPDRVELVAPDASPLLVSEAVERALHAQRPREQNYESLSWERVVHDTANIYYDVLGRRPQALVQ